MDRQLNVNTDALTLSNEEFKQIRFMVFQTTGINLTSSKKALIISRLARRLKELNLDSFSEYIRRLERDSNEIFYLINRITTNLTRFYRESGQFVLLKERVIPDILGPVIGKTKKVLRVWSAGCSTGEEVYTILFEIFDFFKGHIPANLDFKLLGSDIDTNVLTKAKSGRYSNEELTGLTDRSIQTYFDRISDNVFQVKDKYRKHVVFSRINLVYDSFKFNHKIDVIFCRNVVIYFTNETKKGVYEKFHSVLNDPGYFFSGHSENLFMYPHIFKLIEKSLYKKVV